jgi:hypothetical protein
MAKDKKSFLLYVDLIHTVDKLPNDKAGELFKLILNYVNDLNPTTEDLLLNVAFEPIKQQLKRDLRRYESICERNKINGLKGGRPQNPEEPKKPSGLSGNPEEPKKPDNDKDTDNDIKYKYNKFYDEQINIAEENNNSIYKAFVNFLFVTNPNNEPLKKVLSLSNQISVKILDRLLLTYKSDLIKDKILNLENDVTHKYKSFNLTLQNWLKNDKRN